MTISRKSFAYKVGALLTATAEELDNMIECSRGHYDWRCKQASDVIGEDGAQRNGFLTIWKMRSEHGNEGQELSLGEIDLLCKIMESPEAKYDTYVRLREIFREVSDRWCELAGVPKPNHGPIMHPGPIGPTS